MDELFPPQTKIKIGHLIDHWGHKNQIIVAMEECAELIKELSHHIRDNQFDNHANVIDEVVDVYIMLEQLRQIFSITDLKMRGKIITQVNKAIDRTKR